MARRDTPTPSSWRSGSTSIDSPSTGQSRKTPLTPPPGPTSLGQVARAVDRPILRGMADERLTVRPELQARLTRYALGALADARLVLELELTGPQGDRRQVQVLLSRVLAHELGGELQRGALSLLDVP